MTCTAEVIYYANCKIFEKHSVVESVYIPLWIVDSEHISRYYENTHYTNKYKSIEIIHIMVVDNKMQRFILPAYA